LNPDEWTTVVVSFSGGKDSVATLLRTLEIWPREQIVCHHQALPEDWPETVPYCQDLCAQLNVPLVIEQAYYEVITRPDGRKRRKMHVGPPGLEVGLDGMLALAEDRQMPPTARHCFCLSYYKRELFNRWVRTSRLPVGNERLLTGVLGYAESRGAPPTARIRWCASKDKIDLLETSVRRNRTVLGPRPLALLGTRWAESRGRSKLPWMRKRERVCLKDGRFEMWDLYPILNWRRVQVFRYLRDHEIEPHPAYRYLGMTDHEMYDVDEEGGPRVSCRNCIFASPGDLRVAAAMPANRDLFARTVAFELSTGMSWQQSRSLVATLMRIRPAGVEDIPVIKALLNDHRHVFGFVDWAQVETGVERGELLAAELLGQVIGFVHYRTRRRDEPGLKIVYQVCVAPEYRDWGVGRMLIEAVGRPVRIECPAHLEANIFYAAMGFRLMGTEGDLNVWRHD
jgi:3'-phosphoadenosine 5'-phosphosulfate sulfotransferase (PAPS reductase)/FAD synthetase